MTPAIIFAAAAALFVLGLRAVAWWARRRAARLRVRLEAVGKPLRPYSAAPENENAVSGRLGAFAGTSLDRDMGRRWQSLSAAHAKAPLAPTKANPPSGDIAWAEPAGDLLTGGVTGHVTGHAVESHHHHDHHGHGGSFGGGGASGDWGSSTASHDAGADWGGDGGGD
jgi:uncharacterized membrane protein YgcG